MWKPFNLRDVLHYALVFGWDLYCLCKDTAQHLLERAARDLQWIVYYTVDRNLSDMIEWYQV